MGLSSNVLWHQTSEEYFYKILSEKRLKYAYSLERVIAPEGGKEIAFPMISMCNLPLSEFSGYISRYGGFSLGFSQQWGKINGFTSVWYCDDTSKVRKSLVTDLKKKSGEVTSLIIKVFSYIKLTEDEMPKRNYSNYRFADEREVRLVPTFEELNAINEKALLDKNKYDEYKNAKGNPTINLSVSYDMGDLRYLIVPTEEDAENVAEFFRKQGLSLTIPVLTHLQILNDFIGQDHNKRISIVDTLSDEELLQAARKHLNSKDKDVLKQLRTLLDN